MMPTTQIAIPSLVRVKDGALDRVGLYLDRMSRKKVTVFCSEGLLDALQQRLRASLDRSSIQVANWIAVTDNDLEAAARHFVDLPTGTSAILGLGGGKALDVAKYVAFLGRIPYLAIPTSLSNDGFCSPQSSLTVRARRKSVPSAMPTGVIADIGVCAQAPRLLTLSGVGDLVAKLTAVKDWKLSFHATGEPVNDFAALLSDGALHAFRSHPVLDSDGIRLLATGLLLNGISMEIAGSSRPASGGEHLISHALDAISAHPRLHGLQVGVASYLTSLLQEQNSSLIEELLERTGFWEAIAQEPFSLEEWRRAIELAPTLKPNFHTVLSEPKSIERAQEFLTSNRRLRSCIL
jgi:glycerol-1-phosphate dehydrogenase [NAD(P)+]